MSDVTVLGDAGTLLAGTYDGYGRVDDHELVELAPQVFHTACWNAAGQPTTYRGESAWAPDQGWFFDDGDHDLAGPPPAPAHS